MSALFKALSELIISMRSAWKRLEKNVDKGTIRVVYITLTMLFVFETILVSLVIAYIFLRTF